MSKLRIAIVNDLKMMVEYLKRIVTSINEYEVAWTACNGAEAVEKCAQDTPDIILMDLLMPVMGGEEAVKIIMQNNPCAILIVTFSVNVNASKVFEAMGYGALDAVSAPRLDSKNDHERASDLLKKIEIIGKLIGKQPSKITFVTEKERASREIFKHEYPLLLTIGVSTGGPKALTEIIRHFPKNFPVATVIIQHVDKQFSQGLAEWLSRSCELPVKIATNACRPTPGVIWIAGTNDHLVMCRGGQMRYTEEPIDLPYRPSVDVFFKSVVKCWPRPFVSVLLTGMGSDGAQGLKSMKQAGWYTIAQDKETSLVFGMPKAAIELHAVDRTLPLYEIGPEILRLIKKKMRV